MTSEVHEKLAAFGEMTPFDLAQLVELFAKLYDDAANQIQLEKEYVVWCPAMLNLVCSHRILAREAVALSAAASRFAHVVNSKPRKEPAP